jgi:hypothetical protein
MRGESSNSGGGEDCGRLGLRAVSGAPRQDGSLRVWAEKKSSIKT